MPIQNRSVILLSACLLLTIATRGSLGGHGGSSASPLAIGWRVFCWLSNNLGSSPGWHPLMGFLGLQHGFPRMVGHATCWSLSSESRCIAVVFQHVDSQVRNWQDLQRIYDNSQDSCRIWKFNPALIYGINLGELSRAIATVCMHAGL